MDIDTDGHIDILSGSYHQDTDHPHMTGVFWVLRGKADGTFAKPEILDGTDGAPLVIHVPDGGDDRRAICTRPTAIDFDGDGDLDIVAGNFEGTFHLFEGLGDGRFEPRSTALTTRTGEELTVRHHSDPVLVDWDGDGDLDLLSGSGQGVHICVNVGEDGRNEWTQARDVFSFPGPTSYSNDELVFGDGHITEPQGSIRIWIDDVNGDGLFDVLMGDHSYTATYPLGELSEEECRAAIAIWEKEREPIEERADGEWTDELMRHYMRRSEILQEGAGFVWVAYQRGDAADQAEAPISGD